MTITMTRAATLIIGEGEPTAYPDRPTGLSSVAAEIAPAVIWGRLESWISTRWSERAVSFTVEGEGCWSSPIGPFALTDAREWDAASESYVPTTLAKSPTGFRLEANVYQIEGTAGFTTTPPDRVLEAYRRYAEFCAEAIRDPKRVGTSAHTLDLDGAISRSTSQPSSWLTRGLHLSGAADLLRPWRRLGSH